MADMSEQIEYWQMIAEEDWEVGRQLIGNNKTRHGLFFVHLTLEKLAKACFCKTRGKTPPKIHNIVRISELAGLDVPDDICRFMARMNEFNLEGRYPWLLIKPPSKAEALEYYNQANEVMLWLKKQL